MTRRRIAVLLLIPALRGADRQSMMLESGTGHGRFPQRPTPL